MLNKRDLKSAIVGMTLGDGHLRRRGNSVIMVMCHSTKQIEYARWKSGILSQETRMRENIWKPNNSYNDSREFITVSSMAHPVYREIHETVYSSNKKVITDKVLSYLSPMALAIWWMDDGNLYHHWKRCSKEDRSSDEKVGQYRSAGWEATLSTQSFSEDDNRKIIGYLKGEHLIDCTIKNVMGQNVIRINGTEFEKLVEVIRPFIHPSLTYKVDKNSDWHLRK
jgi:recombination protein RecA